MLGKFTFQERVGSHKFWGTSDLKYVSRLCYFTRETFLCFLVSDICLKLTRIGYCLHSDFREKGNGKV